MRRFALALAALVTTGVALLLLDRWADSMLAAHMLQHMLLGDLAPLLLVLAARGRLRVSLAPRVARAAQVIRLRPLVETATRPVPAALAWSLSLAAWHVPVAYDLALHHAELHALEHGCFFATGVLVWSVLLDPPGRNLLPGWRRFGYALTLLAASGALANVLVLSYRPLYPAYASPGSRPLGLSPLQDQDLAGLVMMVEQLLTFGSFALLTARSQLARAQATAPPGRHPLAA